MRLGSILRAATAASVLFVSASTQATIIGYALSVEFSGATPPEGVAPWLTATFDDANTPGSVELTLEATNLTDKEFVFEWSFNLDPALDPNMLVFSSPSKTGAFADPVINTGADAFKADGDGLFDVRIDFSNGGGSNNRFGVGETAVYTITGIPGLTAGSFDFLSAPAGGHGPFPTVAHVGGIGESDDYSGWITVPEPTSLCLLAGAGVALIRRRR